MTTRDERSLDNKRECLLKVMDAICGDRQLNYGNPEDNFSRIAALWNVYLRDRAATWDAAITPVDVAILMVLMKVARLANTPGHLDSWLDISGYAACGYDIAVEQARQDAIPPPSYRASPAPDLSSMEDIGMSPDLREGD